MSAPRHLALAAGLAMLLAPPAAAQTGGTAKPGGPGAGTGGLPLPSGGTTKDLTAPGNGGVAGTGLGGSTAPGGDGASTGRTSDDTGAAAAPGTGGSVKGPAGQGIDGQGGAGRVAKPGTTAK